MKSKAAIVWFVISLGLGVALAVQLKNQHQANAKMQALQVQVEQMSQETRQARTELEKARAERAQVQGELVAAQVEMSRAKVAVPATAPSPGGSAVSSAGQPAAESAPGKGNMAAMLGNMMKDPEMRKAMAAQQRMGLNMVYGNLFKELQLTPDQEEKLKDILINQQITNMTQAGVLMNSGGDRKELAQKMAEDQKQTQEQIKNLLGDEKYAEFQDYNQTLGERMMLDQMGKDIAMTPEQRDQLLQIVKEEKKNVQINTGTLTTDPTQQNMQAAFGSPDATERVLSQQQQVNQRVLERAGQILTPEQIRKLEPVLNSQLEMQKVGLKMAREMFGGQNSGAEQKP